jgi:arylsulfatase
MSDGSRLNKCLVAWLVIALAPVVAEAAERPNIVLIMADDMGFSDIGCYGSEIETPNLDALAANGLRFTQFYNTGRCCPTRASLLTGLYQHQTGIGMMMSDRGLPGYRGDLNEHCLTIAQPLKRANYRNYMAGNWHVTPYDADNIDNPDRSNWPLQRGFDRFYGTIHGAGSLFDPNSLTRDNQYISPFDDPKYKPEQYYYTDAISDHATRYVKKHQQNHPDKPFFMYVSYTAAHWPMHALKEDIEKYKGKYDVGYEAIRQARFNRMREMGLLEDNSPLSNRAGDWDNVEHKQWEARCMAVYAAMIDRMDQGIGKIVDQLEAAGEFDNTLVLYLQDNGGCAEGLGRRSKRPGWIEGFGSDDGPPTTDSALQTYMVPPVTRDGTKVKMGPGVMPGPADTYIAYGRNWANVSNTPFRYYKHWVHEGGIATPLIAHWPEGIASNRYGEFERQPGHLVDIMTTCLDISGAAYPESHDGEKLKPLQGVSLTPTFEGKSLDREQPLFFEHGGKRALRDGKWKLVARGTKAEWELYNMAADRSETNNLADQYPKRLKHMVKHWESLAKQYNAIPWPRSGKYSKQNMK